MDIQELLKHQKAWQCEIMRIAHAGQRYDGELKFAQVQLKAINEEIKKC